MPPPEPKSRTVSPAFSSARAVGLPQPSDAATAVSGSSPDWAASYRSDVIGSQPSRGDAPQQLFPSPLTTRNAAWPYFSLTISFRSPLICISYLQQRIFSGSTALLRVQHSA